MCCFCWDGMSCYRCAVPLIVDYIDTCIAIHIYSIRFRTVANINVYIVVLLTLFFITPKLENFIGLYQRAYDRYSSDRCLLSEARILRLSDYIILIMIACRMVVNSYSGNVLDVPQKNTPLRIRTIFTPSYR